MSELARAQDWVGRVAYKPGWSFAVHAAHGSAWLCATLRVIDARAPTRETTVTGEVPLGEASLSDPDAFLCKLRDLITHLELHEVGEWLTFDNKRPFDPHR